MAKVAKKTSAFAPSQEANQARRVKLIRAYLATLKRSRVELKYVTRLARFVAVHISEVEKAPCDASTLLRNDRYKTLLLSYMADGAVPKGQESLGAAATAVQEMALRLDAANLRRENDRLKAHLASVNSEDRGDVPALCDLPSVQDTFEEDFVLTCQLVRRIIDSLHGTIAVDKKRGEILDESRKFDKVIAETRIAAPFVRWLLSNGY